MDKGLFNREKSSIFQTYKRLPIEIDYASGVRIFDKHGKVYLDFLGGIAVNALGHCHPKTIEAIESQIRKYMHVSNYFYQEPQILLAEKLKEMTGFDRVFFSNSGTEAVEGALKLCRRWGNLNLKKNIISFTGAFHGRTYGALSLMDKPLYKSGMEPFLDGINILEFNNVDMLEKSVDEKTCAVFIEFLQGEGGISRASDKFVYRLKQLHEKYKFIIVADEVQSGTGRTGKFFSFEHYDIHPEIVTLAKGLGGGLPLGCILARDEFASVWEKGMHGTTYGGNAVACAAGLTVLEELENGVLDNVILIGNYLYKKLELVRSEYPQLIKDVRGMGLMKGLLLTFDAVQLVEKLLERGIIANAASGFVLRLVPPLILTKNDVDEFIAGLRISLGSIIAV